MNRKTAVMLLVTAALLFSFSAFSQAKNTAAQKAVADTTPPKLTIKFGPYADSAKVLLANVKPLVPLELKATDAKGVVYTVVAYSFAWKRKDITDDYKTGKPRTIFIYNSVDVKGDAHLPAAWQQEIKETVQSKEEFRFFDLLVQHPKTKKLYKPAAITLFIL